MHRGGRFELLEAKWTETPKERDAIPLEKVAEALAPKNVETKKIACRTPSAYPMESGTWAEPLG